MNIDYTAAGDFLAAFFGPTTEHNVELRSLPQEHGGGPNRPRFTRDTEIACEHLVKWDQPGRACYFGACTRITGKASGSRADCAEMPALWVDIDCEKQSFSKTDAVSAALSLPLRPSLLVDSGGGIHGYWLLNEAMPVLQGPLCDDEAIIAVLRQLAGVLAGDPAVCDIARVMRLPGTHNFKYGDEGRRCLLLRESDFSIRYEFSDLVEMLDVQRRVLISAAPPKIGTIPIDDPFLGQAARLPFKPPVDVEQRFFDMKYEGVGEAAIHPTRCSVSSSLKARGMSDSDVFDILMSETKRVASEAGVAWAWNWKREEKTIWEEIRTAKVKYAPKDPPVVVKQELQLISGGLDGNAAIAITPLPVAQRNIARNDRGNAQILIEDHGSDIRYVLGIGWHVWDGRRYCADPENVEIARLAHLVHEKLLRAAAKDAKALKWAIQCGNSARLSNMAREARPYVYCDNADLDADAFLLNCSNGTLNLKTGGLGPHRQGDLITKLVPLDYDPRALCPVWDSFVLSIFGGDADLVDFLQRCVGYSLTGDCREQVIFILHGLGSNGKSVLIETLSALLSDYVEHCPSDTFVSRQVGGIPNDLAALVGARFVSVVETEHGRSLAEGLVKQATGGDAMQVRFLHKEFFKFVPKFKLWLATNHKPVIRGSDLAIWRRIRLLPFGETFVDGDKAIEGQRVKDPDLKMKLMDELPGILAWAVRGCSEWLTRGLVVPEAVEKATRLYQESQSPVTKFIAECCHIARACECEFGELYEAYVFWCKEADEDAFSKKRFGSTLDECGYVSRRDTTGDKRMRKGIDIKLEFRQEILKKASDASVYDR